MEIPLTTLLLLAVLLFALGAATGVFGLGIGVVGAPILSFALRDQLPNVAPLSLALNAATCAAAVVVLAPHGLIAWKHASWLGTIAAIMAPFAAAIDRNVPHYVTWYVDLGAILFLVFHLLRPPRGHSLPRVNWTVLYFGAPPAALVGGFTGIGPGFAMMPGLVVAGMDVRHAAATAAAAGILPSLTALVPLRQEITLGVSPVSGVVLLAASISGTLFGAMFTARRNVTLRWQRTFAWLVAGLGVAHFFTLGGV